MTAQEYAEKASKLRNSPMVKAWIAARSARQSYSDDKDCHRCGFPHASNLLCGAGATFGRLTLGGHAYSIDYSNVIYFHDFVTNLGKGWGFHWRDEIFFERKEDGGVEVRYIEQFNNTPQIKTWRIPPAEWASIVCSVSADGETGERWNAAQDFHGRTSPVTRPEQHQGGK